MKPDTKPTDQDMLSREIARAREAEREHLARELHDGLGQNLTAVKMSLEVLAAAHPASERIARDAISLVDQMLRSVRSLAVDLRPPALESGLVRAIQSHIEAEAKLTGLALHLETTFGDVPLREDIALALFRIVQEAVSNVVRHASATHVWISLHKRDGVLELSIRDDGRGFHRGKKAEPSSQSGGMGLHAMRERTILLGGEFHVESRLGEGTTILACVPHP